MYDYDTVVVRLWAREAQGHKNDPSRIHDGSEQLMTRLPDVDVEVHTCRIGLVTVIVPTARVVMVVIIIVTFVAALQCESRNCGKEEQADDVFELIFLFHNHALKR